MLTTSPPSSVHFVGAAVKRATGARWVADLRDSLVAHPHRRAERRLVRIKEQGERGVAALVARYADAVVAAAEAIADEARTLEPRGAGGDDRERLRLRRLRRARAPAVGALPDHAHRQLLRPARPAPVPDRARRLRSDVVARFVGDFRPADREWAEGLGLGDRLELIPYVPRRRSLELQRDSEALLLLIPEAGGRGRGVLSGKVFEYLAAERPILAVVPPDGAAAELIRETRCRRDRPTRRRPRDPRGAGGLHARWRAGDLDGTPLDAQTRRRLARETRVEELAELLRSLV